MFFMFKKKNFYASTWSLLINSYKITKLFNKHIEFSDTYQLNKTPNNFFFKFKFLNTNNFSTKTNSNLLFNLFSFFKTDLFSRLQFTNAWNFVKHFFWTKTRVAYYMNNWIYTTNHKRIAVNYFWFVILSGIVGMVLATLIRLEFAYPGAGVFVGDSLQYLSLATAHGVIMVFFMIMPLLFGAFANFLLPTQLGVHDVAFPRLNSAAFWFLPGGLLMLCQLVCVDKRYQRMNCFNIREIQAILKKNFFADLVNNQDYHEFLNLTAIGLRFKSPVTTAINSNFNVFSTYNVTLAPKLKFNSYEYTNTKNFVETFKINNFFLNRTLTLITSGITIVGKPLFYGLAILTNPMYFSTKLIKFFSQSGDSFLTTTISCTNYFLTSVVFYAAVIAEHVTAIKIFLMKTTTRFITLPSLDSSYQTIALIGKEFIVFLTIFSELRQLFNLFSKENKLNYIAMTLLSVGLEVTAFMLRILGRVLHYFHFKSKKNENFFNLRFDYFIEVISLQLNSVVFGLAPNKIHKNLYNFFSQLSRFVTYDVKNNFLNLKTLNLSSDSSAIYAKFSTIEQTNNFRQNKFYNPALKYNYKSGDYFTKFSKETYTYLFSILLDLNSLTKLTPWFKAEKYKDALNLNVDNFFEKLTFTSPLKLNAVKWTPHVFGSTDGFYNFFFECTSNLTAVNFQHLSTLNLQQKFYKMFHTNSIQQRILSNWRQIKFTREAWRCKLLATRHQKTLFRRFTHEDGVFWSIERNAKDLLPGWAMITPFSSRTRFTAVGKTDIGLMGVLLVLNSSIISAANFLVTYRYLSTLNNRKMRDARAFFTEGVMVASWMMVTANPMLVIGIIMLLSDRHWQTSFFDYSGGGDTVLFQHMFWFFGHPEVYIIIIPTFGFTNTMLSFYFRKRVSARASLLYSMYTIAFLGFFVWGHHMYMVGLAHTTRMLFSTLTVMISVPAATKIMHWCVTFVNSSFAAELPLLFILTFIFFFVSGGISGMCVAHTGMDILFHDTFYVIGHFHVMLAGAGMFASFGAFYFYFPAIFGVKYSRLYAYLHYSYYLIGQLMTVIPMFWLGYAGMPRRVLDYPASLGGWHSVISAGHMLSVAGLMSFFIMIFDSLRQGRAVVRNSFGISRYNTRLNFYIYATAQNIFAQQKGLFLFKFLKPGALKLNKFNYKNYEIFETTLISYNFHKIN